MYWMWPLSGFLAGHRPARSGLGYCKALRMTDLITQTYHPFDTRAEAALRMMVER